MAQDAAWPVELVFNRSERLLKIAFTDGVSRQIPFELLRVESPSAEVRGHGGKRKLPPGKRNVGVKDARPVGNYAVRIVFDDGHDTGIYSWDYLRELGDDASARLRAYAEALAKAGLKRDA